MTARNLRTVKVTTQAKYFEICRNVEEEEIFLTSRFDFEYFLSYYIRAEPLTSVLKTSPISNHLLFSQATLYLRTQYRVFILFVINVYCLKHQVFYCSSEKTMPRLGW
jgi:hypothetical protein